MTSNVPPFPTEWRPQVDEVADWVEYYVLATGRQFKRGDLKSALSRENLANPDLVEQSVWSELLHRSRIYGERWPIAVSGERLEPNATDPDELTIYKYFCLLGMGQLDDIDRRLFEEIVTVLLAAIFGPNALRIGAPASPGMPKSFRKRVAHYASISGLLQNELTQDPLPKDKDLGLDVIGWWPWKDGRGGYLHFLVQCATGRDWREKLSDINLKVLNRHINWSVMPVRVFSVPRVISLAEDFWIRVADEGGLILDRPRLHELLKQSAFDASMVRDIGARVEELSIA